MNARSSGPCEKDVSVDAPSATIGAMAEEEEEAVDDGKIVTFARGGVTALARTTGRTSLAREAREISLVRIARAATQAFLLCRHRQEGMTTIIRTRGLVASRSHVLWLAPWAVPRPQPLSASSNG